MKKNKMFKISYKALSLCLALIMLLSTFTALPVSAKTTTEMKNEISDLEAKSAELEKEIAALKKDKTEKQKLRDTLQSQIDTTQSKINACTKIIAGYSAEIEEHKKEIRAKNEQISETKFLFKKRMRSIYMTGSTNNELLILLDANNFSDYLALSEVSKTISAHDKKLVNTMLEAIEAINLANKEINDKIAAQADIKEVLAAEQEKLKTQQNEINEVISSLSSDQSALEKQNKSYENAINSLEKQIKAQLSTTTNNPVFTSGQFTWPLPGYYTITSPYGSRWGTIHKGMDISGSNVRGKPIVAAADGVVLNAGWNSGGYGYWVVINHGVHNGVQYSTLYGHMIGNPVVSAGQTVKAGQHIGNVGTTGYSFGNHLHFEIWVNGSHTNPMNYFSKVK